MPTVRIPLVGSLTVRDIALTGPAVEQDFTNCFPEVVTNSITGQRTPKLLKRPGYIKRGALTGVVSATTSGAITAWTGSVSTLGAAVFQNNGGVTSVWDIVNSTQIGGDISNTVGASCLTETMVSGTPHLVGNFYDSSTGVLERWYFPEGGAWTQVTDADFPASTIVGRPAHMDGYTFDMTSDGKVYNSDLNSVSSYTATNYFPTNAYPDRGVTVVRHHQYILAFGENSIELLVNNGNPTGSPLRREGAIRMGAARRDDLGTADDHVQTVLPAFGSVYWLATENNGAAVGVYRLKGLEPEKISTPAIDLLIPFLGFVGTLVLHGQRHVVLRGSAGGSITWAYSIDTNTWWRISLASGEMYGAVAIATSSFGPSAVSHFVGTNNARCNIFTVSANNQDDGSNYTQTVRTEEMTLGTDKLKFWNRLRADYDRQASTSNLAVSYSDDGGTTFSTARNIDMSAAGGPGLTRLGASRRRIWKFTNAAATPSGVRAVEIDYTVGAH